MILAIDTSTRYAGIALGEENLPNRHSGKCRNPRLPGVLEARIWYSLGNHTQELMPAVAQTLQNRGLNVKGLEAIAVALGPGSFSALRVGISVAKGLAVAARKPILGVGTLDLEAFPYLQSGLPVVALLDGGRGEVASAFFGADGSRKRADLIGPLDAVLDSIAEPTLFCGEGVNSPGHQPRDTGEVVPVSRASFIRERLGNRGLVICQQTPAGRLGALVEIARSRLDAGEANDLTTLQPYYLKLPSIGIPKHRDHTRQG